MLGIALRPQYLALWLWEQMTNGLRQHIEITNTKSMVAQNVQLLVKCQKVMMDISNLGNEKNKKSI